VRPVVLAVRDPTVGRHAHAAALALATRPDDPDLATVCPPLVILAVGADCATTGGGGLCQGCVAFFLCRNKCFTSRRKKH